jgi:hypothetical protein
MATKLRDVIVVRHASKIQHDPCYLVRRYPELRWSKDAHFRTRCEVSEMMCYSSS